MAELQERKEKKRKDDIRSAVATAGEEGGGVSICPHNGDLLCCVYTEVRAQSMVGGPREGCARGTTQCEGSALRVEQRPLTQTDSLSLLQRPVKGHAETQLPV